MRERPKMRVRLHWMIGVLTLLAVSCSSGGSANGAAISTPIPATETILEQLVKGFTWPTRVDPAEQVGDSSPPSPGGDIVFEMEEVYRLGEPVDIVVRNYSNLDYYYQFQYPACYNLQFFDDSQESRPYPNADRVLTQRYLSPGRFIVPRGTHCDTIWEKSINPGQSVVLFTWDQQMCIKDRFGCIESVPVEPGEFLVRGEFSSAARVIGPGWDRKPDVITTITWGFTIRPP